MIENMGIDKDNNVEQPQEKLKTHFYGLCLHLPSPKV